MSQQTNATPAVTGDRVTRKVRRLAAEFPELGRVRHVEANPPSPKAWAVTLGFVAFCVIGAAIGNATVAGALGMLPIWLAICGGILWYYGGEKVVVFDRGLLIGSFAPFLRPHVVPFAQFAVGSITAVRPAWKLAAMLTPRTSLFTGRNTIWAFNGVAFVAVFGPVARRKYVDAAGTFSGHGARPSTAIVWWFATWRQPDRLVKALEAALVDLGHPVVGLSHHVLPLVRISGKPADAATQVPRLVAALEQSF
ncbi:hypothetical protein BWI15_32760 [Kribbella sp. ALI-6-A]|uniref:hypothetical protein n=1 Tax=Kribbella sp. ALI-6-A TaxID=1933817 RepID=UPI00097BD9FA|nr:hypothetical protein [Kribbella sp. ALI-6-A]ONI67847.1 hypothetical protein BWI15_32760 [Kribbella sp. ALI-6-A]